MFIELAKGVALCWHCVFLHGFNMRVWRQRPGQTHSIEYEIQTRSGLRYFEGRAKPLGVKVGGQAAVVFLARDITQRKQTEGALRESELRFRLLLRNIPSISVQGYLEDGTSRYWNQASEHLYGYTTEEALDSNLLDLIIPPPCATRCAPMSAACLLRAR